MKALKLVPVMLLAGCASSRYVTLAPDGEPLLYDSIHRCGCYHKFFPTPRARPLVTRYVLRPYGELRFDLAERP